MKMEVTIVGIGKMGKEMGSGFILIKVAQHIKAYGKMTSRKEKLSSTLVRIKTKQIDMKGFFRKDRDMERATTIIMMENGTKDSGREEENMDLGNSATMKTWKITLFALKLSRANGTGEEELFGKKIMMKTFDVVSEILSIFRHFSRKIYLINYSQSKNKKIKLFL
jgi:hypothetical protein